MALIRLVAEEEATGKVKALYEEIKAEHGIDFVPNLYRAKYLPGWLHWLPRLQIEGRRAALVVTPGTSGVARPRQRRRDPKEVSR